MKTSYINYAMSVIVGRALPDVRDGLKPVHRRILFGMKEQGMTHDKPYKKSARIVGDVMGKYHPHGDAAIYDTMVRMAQDFSMRYPLADGQGNFGSIDGDAAAAMRYTEIRLWNLAQEILDDLDKDTVDFIPNYDGSLKEPVILPSKVPNLLINGSTGIAVGMSTNMPPHNLREIVDAVIMTIDNPEVTTQELMSVVHGPDFPTGAYIYGRSGIHRAYETGRGIIKIRAKTTVEQHKNKESIIINEMPYQVNKAKLIENIANLVKEKKILGITDLRDESDRNGIRAVIELSRGTNADVVLNQLFRHTQMESSFGIINLALVDGQPMILGLKDIIRHFIDHRVEVVTRRSIFEMEKAKKRAHILEGLQIALDHIDQVIALIRQSQTTDEAKTRLIAELDLSQEQAKAILDMRLQRLTGLEREKIDNEHKELMETIRWLQEVLGDKNKILSIIKQEIIDIKDRYGDDRRTQIIDGDTEMEDEDLIPVEDVVVTISNSGYIKRLPVHTYKQQRRGGRGVIGMDTKETDFVVDLFVASTHDYILFFTDKGRVYWLKVYEIPDASRQSRGKAIINLIEVDNDENITAQIPVKAFKDDQYLIMATDCGVVKKTVLSAFSNPRRSGIIAITLDEGDELKIVKLTDGHKDIIIGSRHGKAIRFSEADVRATGRGARGVRGIRLIGDDCVVGMDIVRDDATLLTITENGFGKRTQFGEYRKMNRGGQGVITIISSIRNGMVVDVKAINETDELMVTTSGGIIIRVPVSDIRIQGRNTQGVKIMNVKNKDKVMAVARVVVDNDKISNENEILPSIGFS
ncbi:MAG: DNA gyrase subunit A [Candidatus Methanomarinus sp.]|uniref:DNA gyrase subunit A n=1 Tax=Candidatus Methanomarinus sp. TaxID=3386244 RepID=A0AC61SC93_9EURY|nr:MAG: DNA gyrase subunit A [ANME-2 cluster archaeon]